MTATNADLIGRADANDLESILAVANRDGSSDSHEVDSHYGTLFTWNYDKGARARLDRLYEKAKTSQWNGQTDLPWDTDVDQEAVVEAN
ncbi:MAG: ferritin-like domain-containing protein, partial [Acidimicrobiales bacterium]